MGRAAFTRNAVRHRGGSRRGTPHHAGRPVIPLANLVRHGVNRMVDFERLITPPIVTTPLPKRVILSRTRLTCNRAGVQAIETDDVTRSPVTKRDFSVAE